MSELKVGDWCPICGIAHSGDPGFICIGMLKKAHKNALDANLALTAERDEANAALEYSRDVIRTAVDCENAARAEAERLRWQLTRADETCRRLHKEYDCSADDTNECGWTSYFDLEPPAALRPPAPSEAGKDEGGHMDLPGAIVGTGAGPGSWWVGKAEAAPSRLVYPTERPCLCCYEGCHELGCGCRPKDEVAGGE